MDLGMDLDMDLGMDFESDLGVGLGFIITMFNIPFFSSS
jgi:hypothetical protein